MAGSTTILDAKMPPSIDSSFDEIVALFALEGVAGIFHPNRRIIGVSGAAIQSPC